MNSEMQRRLFAPLVRGLFVCLLGYSGLAAAGAITEAEPNDWSNPQIVQVPPEGLTISGVIDGTWDVMAVDADFFAFKAYAENVLSIKIVGTLNPADGTSNCFPSNLAIYDSLGQVKALSQVVECPNEARIDNVALAADGTYFVAVSSFTHYFLNLEDGLVDNQGVPTPGGTYQLVISGVQAPPADPTPTPTPVPQPSVKHVPIEIRHWHQDERDLEKRRGMNPITVAILSTKHFDATTVDPNSLTFGAKGDEKSLFRCRKDGVDINRDGRIDMVCYFKPDVANFQTGDLNGKLEGKTLETAGKPARQIKGTAALKIFSVPAERRGFKHRGDHGNDRDDRHDGYDKGKR